MIVGLKYLTWRRCRSGGNTIGTPGVLLG
jgi:hypothetical protein